MPAVHRLLLRDTCKHAGPAASNAPFEAGYRARHAVLSLSLYSAREHRIRSIAILKTFEKMQYSQHMNMLLYNGPASRPNIFAFPEKSAPGERYFQ